MNSPNLMPSDQFALGIKSFDDIMVDKHYIIRFPHSSDSFIGKVIEKLDDRLRVLFVDDDYQTTLLNSEINNETFMPSRYSFFAPYARPMAGGKRRTRRTRQTRQTRRTRRT
jgi:hypothetical protein